jgi:hypothetical protein
VDYLTTSAASSNYYAVFNSAGAAVKEATVYMNNGALLSIASNPAQNAFAVCGKADDLSDIIPGTGSSTNDAAGGGMDIVVAKIDNAGNVLWGRQFGGAGDQICQSVTMDNNGDVIISGNYNGTLAFDTVNLATVTSSSVALLYVAKLNGADGTGISAKTWGTSGRVIPYGITVDANSNIIVAGSLGATVDFGGGHVATDLGATDALVLKLTSSLGVVWAQSFGDAANDQQAKTVAVSSNGDVYVAGVFQGSMGAMNLTSFATTNIDAFVGHLAAADGSVVCAQVYGDATAGQGASAITVARAATGASLDSLVVGGAYAGTMTFGSTVLNTTSPSISGSYVARLHP